MSAAAQEIAVPFDSVKFAATAGSKGVMLAAVTWGRQYQCGAFETAQLRSLSFDKAGIPKTGDTAKADLIIADSSVLPTGSNSPFVTYAFIAEAGEYLLSAFDVRLARSVRDVGHYKGERSRLISEGKSRGGSFTINAGEIVYIGHFGLDCAFEPIPWRYYPESRDAFAAYLRELGKEFPGLTVDRVNFRLFKTTMMGRPFELPQ
jgi:hypothetical protein